MTVFLDALPGRRVAVPRAEVQAFADALRANPGKWAACPWEMPAHQARTRASDITTGRSTAPVPLRTGFQGATREGTLYVRYIGEEA